MTTQPASERRPLYLGEFRFCSMPLCKSEAKRRCEQCHALICYRHAGRDGRCTTCRGEARAIKEAK